MTDALSTSVAAWVAYGICAACLVLTLVNTRFYLAWRHSRILRKRWLGWFIVRQACTIAYILETIGFLFVTDPYLQLVDKYFKFLCWLPDILEKVVRTWKLYFWMKKAVGEAWIDGQLTVLTTRNFSNYLSASGTAATDTVQSSTARESSGTDSDDASTAILRKVAAGRKKQEEENPLRDEIRHLKQRNWFLRHETWGKHRFLKPAYIVILLVELLILVPVEYVSLTKGGAYTTWIFVLFGAMAGGEAIFMLVILFMMRGAKDTFYIKREFGLMFLSLLIEVPVFAVVWPSLAKWPTARSEIAFLWQLIYYMCADQLSCVFLPALWAKKDELGEQGRERALADVAPRDRAEAYLDLAEQETTLLVPIVALDVEVGLRSPEAQAKLQSKREKFPRAMADPEIHEAFASFMRGANEDWRAYLMVEAARDMAAKHSDYHEGMFLLFYPDFVEPGGLREVRCLQGTKAAADLCWIYEALCEANDTNVVPARTPRPQWLLDKIPDDIPKAMEPAVHECLDYLLFQYARFLRSDFAEAIRVRREKARLKRERLDNAVAKRSPVMDTLEEAAAQGERGSDEGITTLGSSDMN